MTRYFQNLPSAEIIELNGLSRVLSSKSTKELKVNLGNAIFPISSELDCVFAGKIVENPTELLGGERISELLALLRNVYQIILVDCPPVLPVTDASVICRYVDGVVVITYGGKTKINALQATIEVLQSVKCNIYGIVINKIPNSRESADYGYRSGYSKYYKRSYGYGLRKRGYIPYGPYDPKDELKIDTKASDKNSKAPVDFSHSSSTDNPGVNTEMKASRYAANFSRRRDENLSFDEMLAKIDEQEAEISSKANSKRQKNNPRKR
jgi:hypothetical protein